jgi:8-oxo-dGTP diphosphatase
MQDSANPRASPGGTPEAWDEDVEDTLIREAFEESQVRIRRGKAAYLGYQEVHRPGRAPYAQVRMVGMIDEFAPRAPDPDGGRIYRRYMAALSSAPGVLRWGRPAELQVKAAAGVAREWGIPVGTPSPPGYVD